MEFNSKWEYWVWKNSDDAPFRGRYVIDGGTHFNYNIDDIRALIEDRDLTKEEKGYSIVNIPINFAHVIFDKSFEIQSCNLNCDFELYDCKFNYRFIIIHDKFSRIFDISGSHFNVGLFFYL